MSVILECDVDAPLEVHQRDMLSALRGSRNAIDDVVAFRMAPLLLITPRSLPTQVVIGTVAILVRHPESVLLKVSVAGMWRRDSVYDLFLPVDDQAVRQEAVSEVEVELQTLATAESNSLAELAGQELAAQCAKAISERSRNAVQHLREFRYAVEEAFARASSAQRPTVEHTEAVSLLVQLSVICGRAHDQAREAVREGLCLHLDDVEAYHAYRKARDPSILNHYVAATSESRSWMRLHDATVRQCEELQQQLQSESDAIRSLVLAGSSISGAYDAEEQAKSNALASAASIGLGLPALVLTFYGASALLPVSGHVLAFILVALAPLALAANAVRRNHRLERKPLFCTETNLLLGGFGLLLLAALIAR